MVLAYLSPETMMSAVSVIAAVVGAVMMFNRNILLYGAIWLNVSGPVRDSDDESKRCRRFLLCRDQTDSIE